MLQTEQFLTKNNGNMLIQMNPIIMCIFMFVCLVLCGSACDASMLLCIMMDVVDCANVLLCISSCMLHECNE